MKQTFVYQVNQPEYEPVDADGLLAKQLRGLLEHVALSIQYGKPHAGQRLDLISGWRQQGLALGSFGQFVEYDIKLRLGAADDPDFVNPVLRVEAEVDDGIEQDG